MRRALTAGLLVALLAAAYAGYAALVRPAPLDDYGPVGDFALTERHGQTVRPADLQGKVWIASFVFSRCTGPCPQVTGTVARLQKELAREPDVRLVTFTVDPDHDQPGELQKYADHFGADRERWLFLTGPREELYRLIREGFHLGVEQNEGEARTPGNEVTHSSRLAVVDRRGHVRAYFDGRQVDDEGQSVNEVPRVRAAVAALLREGP
jgi:cytochrome oxidase Cu insertion factor (SCO1/SenC/PrrC family)